ncbi:MAG: DNA repair protein RecO [Proteobacteria bacterium]|nr:DNA repair protein RecO [Pseudomonadota bacterium]
MSETHPNRDLCYVLKTFPYKERDLIAVLLSERRGKFSGIARNGVQSRRFGGSLNLFSCSEFDLDAKTIRLAEATDEALVQLLSANLKHATASLSKHFEKLSGASALNELILRTVPSHKPAPELFKLYGNALLALEENPPEKALLLVNAFILKITQWLGVQPQLTRCLACAKPLNEIEGDTVLPRIQSGAWICTSCSTARTNGALTKNVILDAYHAMLHPIRKIEFVASSREHEELLDFLEKHLQYFVPGLDRAPLGSFRFLKSPEWPT